MKSKIINRGRGREAHYARKNAADSAREQMWADALKSIKDHQARVQYVLQDPQAMPPPPNAGGNSGSSPRKH